MAMFSAKDKVGTIVSALPQAADIFRKHQIDFCCGGHRSLSEAVGDTAASVDGVLAELNSAFREMKALGEKHRDWREAPVMDLINHILATHHTYLQRALPELSGLATVVLRAHGQNHPELSRVHKLFHTLKMELEQHLITEEEVLYPAVEAYTEDGDAVLLGQKLGTVDQLEDEHEVAGDVLKELRTLTNQFEAPQDACGTYVYFYEKLVELEGDVFQHIHLENNILHPRVREFLGS